MPTTYDKQGLRFQYPENWVVDDGEVVESATSVTVNSPDGAFWSVVVHPAGVTEKEVLDITLATMRQVYNQLDAEPITELVDGHELIGYDLNFYCLDLTNTALVRAFRSWHATYLVLCQAEDRQFAEIEPVFRAMTRSLLGVLDPTE